MRAGQATRVAISSLHPHPGLIALAEAWHTLGPCLPSVDLVAAVLGVAWQNYGLVGQGQQGQPGVEDVE